jgi:hypothetical protein
MFHCSFDRNSELGKTVPKLVNPLYHPKVKTVFEFSVLFIVRWSRFQIQFIRRNRWGFTNVVRIALRSTGGWVVVLKGFDVFSSGIEIIHAAK